MISFTVAGIAVPQGSKAVNRATGRMFESNKGNLMPWRQDVIAQARQAHHDDPILGPAYVTLRFSFRRPKSHYGTGRNAGVVKLSSAAEHITKPDIDKLTRAVLDALTIAGIWRDDAQVCDLTVKKVYSATPGVEITVLFDADFA